MKIAFDIGGVLSKYPAVFGQLIRALHLAEYHGANVEAWIISDMHPEQKIIDVLAMNGFNPNPDRVKSADYKTHGEMCKAVLCKELGIDLLIDDFPGYVAAGDHVRLLVMPHPTEPYLHDEWKTDGSEEGFGRRVRPTKGDHPWK